MRINTDVVNYMRIIVPEQQSKTQTIKADDYGWLWFHLQTRSSSLFFSQCQILKRT